MSQFSVAGLSATELARRLPVWMAMSELYLDTELDEAAINRIVGNLRDSGYNAIQLKDILHREIAPAFGSNLLNIAGEWERWDEDDVLKIMRRSMEARGLARLKNWMFSVMNAPPNWRQVIAKIS